MNLKADKAETNPLNAFLVDLRQSLVFYYSNSVQKGPQQRDQLCLES
jgi:hypothetical protein